jgi:hypothetical protein
MELGHTEKRGRKAEERGSGGKRRKAEEREERGRGRKGVAREERGGKGGKGRKGVVVIYFGAS